MLDASLRGDRHFSSSLHLLIGFNHVEWGHGAGLGSAFDLFEAIFRDTEDWASLAELLITRAEVIDERDEKVTTLQNAAKVFEDHLEDQDMAFATLQAAHRSPRPALRAVLAMTRYLATAPCSKVAVRAGSARGIRGLEPRLGRGRWRDR